MPPQNTSRRCPQCDHVSAQNRRTQERFACIACGFEENADRVGAINILRAGHARCACEVSEGRSPAAGTRRSDSGATSCCLMNAVGIPRLQAREDVNMYSAYQCGHCSSCLPVRFSLRAFTMSESTRHPRADPGVPRGYPNGMTITSTLISLIASSSLRSVAGSNGPDARPPASCRCAPGIGWIDGIDRRTRS